MQKRLRARVLGGITVILAAAAAVSAQEGAKPQLSVFAETYQFSIPGLDKLPPEARAALGDAAQAQRMLRVQLYSKGAAPATATANLDIPGGLKLGPTLPLEIPRGNGNDPGSPDFKFPKEYEKWEFHRYWGCSATVKPGQPRVVKGATLSAEQLERAAKAAKAADGKVPATTWAYWPNTKQPAPKIEPAAAMPGGYQLKTSYVGGVSFQVPEKVNFLAPVELTVTNGNDLTKAVNLSWKPVPNAVGYYAMAIGSKGNNVNIMWISSEVPDGFDGGIQTAGEALAWVQKGVYMPASKTQCTIPAGIFQGCKGVSVQVMAYGPSFTQGNTTPSVRVLTQSTATTSLGLPGFGGGNDGEGEDEN